MKIKRTFTITVDRDLYDQFCVWMHENGFAAGDESSAMKAALRLAIVQEPITAWLQEAKARAWRDCVQHFNNEVYGFLGQLRQQYAESIQKTSPLEAQREG